MGELHLGEQEPTSHGRQLDRHRIASRAVKAYQAGDPLQRIAADAAMRMYDMLRLLSRRVADQSEQLRSQALRRRCSATADVLRKDAYRIVQLLGAGIESSDIPRILAALGATIDIDIAAELLKGPDLLIDPALRQRPILVTDMMWLRYVTGYHRGIEPNYELALGKVPLPEIHSFRMILSEALSRQQIGQVIALVETTAAAIDAGDDEGISFSEYQETREAIIRISSGEGNPLSPPPAERIREGTTGRSWHLALESVGMKSPAVEGGFAAVDYEDASHSYRATEGLFGSPKDVASYDSWMIAEMAAGRDRPSAVAIGRHFGAWESVIGACVPLEEDEFRGIVSHLRTEASADNAWARAGELINEVLRTMPWKSFLSIQYGDGLMDALNHMPRSHRGPTGRGVRSFPSNSFNRTTGRFTPSICWNTVGRNRVWRSPTGTKKRSRWRTPAMSPLRVSEAAGLAMTLTSFDGTPGVSPREPTRTVMSRWQTSCKDPYKPSAMPAEFPF